MDFLLDDKLDLMLDGNELSVQKDEETTLMTAFFTDARMSKQRGYWLNIQSSEIWQYDQSRLTNETARELRETAKTISDKLVDYGLYNRIEADAYVKDGIMTLEINCYDTKQLVFNKKFAV